MHNFIATIRRLLFYSTLLSFFISSAAASQEQKPHFRGVVVNVDEFGVIEFKSGNTSRLWGVVVDPQVLKNLIIGSTILCKRAGATSGGFYFLEAIRNTDVVYCALEQPGKKMDGFDPGVNLSRYLVEKNMAIEFCAETLNKYKSCLIKEDKE